MTTNEHTSRFTTDPIVGTEVTGESVHEIKGRTIRTAWSGIYEGVKASEWDGEPVHFFRDGIIGVTLQGCFAIPVDQFIPAEMKR